jgi:hypothetical protein
MIERMASTSGPLEGLATAARTPAAWVSVLAVGGALLGGCGGGTRTVSVSNSPLATTAGAPARAHTASTHSGSAPATPTTDTPAGTGQGTQVQSTRTAPGPAFLRTGGQSAEQSTGAQAHAAAGVVSAQGYTPLDLSDYHADQTLRVLIGTRTGAAAETERAFFFLNGRYLGTDSSQPSASLRVVSQSDTEVALAYALYRAHDPSCCPSGGQTVVHFQLDNGTLVPLQPIPPVSSPTGLSRQ